MRLLVESELQPAGGVIGAGFEEFRWPKPVRPGDELHIQSEVVEVRPSRSRPNAFVPPSPSCGLRGSYRLESVSYARAHAEDDYRSKVAAYRIGAVPYLRGEREDDPRVGLAAAPLPPLEHPSWSSRVCIFG